MFNCPLCFENHALRTQDVPAHVETLLTASGHSSKHITRCPPKQRTLVLKLLCFKTLCPYT
jgi:hypothetical protein